MGSVVKALVWKNLILRRNHWFQTLRELLFPLLLLLLVNYTLPKFPAVPPNRTETELVCDDTQYHDSALVYNPSTAFTDDLMVKIAKKCGYKRSNVISGNISYPSRHFDYGIEFWNGNELNYTLYPYDGTMPKGLPMWYDESALIMGMVAQRAVQQITIMANSIESEFLADKLKTPKLTSVEMDFFSRETNIYGTLVVIAIYFAYSFLVSPVITRVVEEKECGAKELMRMMGVKSWQLWLARLLDPLMVVVIVACGLVILLYVPLTKTSVVILNVNPLLFWMTYVVGMVSVIFSLFFISCWFDSPIIAGSVAQIVGMASVIILGIMEVSAIAWWKRMCYCLLPHMTLVYSAQLLLNFEYYGKTVNWTERLSVDGSSLNLKEIFIMMVFDIFFYAVLTWYLDNIRPGKYGVPRSWFFFAKGFSAKTDVSPDSTPLKNNETAKTGIYIHQLRKVYHSFGKTPVVAVDCVDLKVPEGRITALLGHNGAGKTTTMHIITGMIPATSGTVFINGHNIRSDPDAARSSLGLCPQQDLLFRDLTAIQTLVFFGMIKGMTRSSAQAEAEELLSRMSMTEARNRQTQNLSGGMKRKLSLGVAIIGGSQVLILDEPTAGVDPQLRREICNLLLSFREQRTILLTTHIMEEADAISDFINIMDHGVIKCSGTPMDLKAKYGTGYKLQVVVKEDDVDGQVTALVESKVNGARFKTKNATTLVYQLPSAETPAFSELFGCLDDMQTKDKIVSYGVSISTLEDVFIRVREIEEEQKRIDEPDGRSTCSMSQILGVTNLEGMSLMWQQFWALSIKKWLVFSRSYVSFGFFACIPLLFILTSNLVMPQLSKMSQDDNSGLSAFFNYSTKMYPGMEIMISSDPDCATCPDFETNFKKVAADRGFLVSKVLNVTEAAYDVFQHNFYQYSRYLALGLELTADKINIQYNTHAVHILPVAVNLINNALLLNTDYRISSSSNLSLIDNSSPAIWEAAQGTSSSLPDNIGVQTLFYMSAVLVEKQHGSKNLIIMATGSAMFWTSHIFFDFVTYAVYAAVITGIYYIFQPNDVIFEDPKSYTCGLMLWGLGMILISYLITLFTRTRGNAISAGLLVYYFFSFFLWPFIATQLVPTWVAYLHPSTIWKLHDTKPSDDDTYLLALFLNAAALFIIIVLIDSKQLGRIFYAFWTVIRPADFTITREIDNDVMDVKKMVENVFGDGFMPVVVSKLCRAYGFRPKAAVREVSFYVKYGQCFGLLGVNGAGKSTTFNMLTAEIARSNGDAIINGHRLSTWACSNYTSQFSYCPQSSGIVPLLEGQEYLVLFARLRGFNRSAVPSVVQNWIQVLDLQECVGKRCGLYSGGMERKIVGAAAFLWDATVVMLDEPTAGVDPVARRSIWKAITTCQEKGNSIILTSHSMEECEALCSQLAIMVDGSFRCIGETTTLKQKFGAGYSVQIKITATPNETTEEFEEAVMRLLGQGCRLTDRHCSILHYHVEDDTTTWRTLFSELEQLKKAFPIFESYIASETTLEEIFLAFAANQRPPSGTQNEVHCVDISS